MASGSLNVPAPAGLETPALSTTISVGGASGSTGTSSLHPVIKLSTSGPSGLTSPATTAMAAQLPSSPSVSSASSAIQVSPSSSSTPKVASTTSPAAASTSSPSQPHVTSSSPSASPTQAPPISPSVHNSQQPSVSTIVSIVVVTPSATSTSTIFPLSTLSTPMVVTEVQHGSTSVGTPSFVTILSTSTNTDGSDVTWTRVYANPTTSPSSHHKTFFENTGAVAGVFTVVGIIAALLLLCAVFSTRFLRRRRRRNQWLASSHDRDSRVTLDDERRSPIPRSLTSETPSEVSRSRILFPTYHTSPSYHLPRVPVPSGIEAEPQGQMVEAERRFNGVQPNRFPLLLDTSLAVPKRVLENFPSTQSTPSVYPISLPPIENEDKPRTIVQPPIPVEVTRSTNGQQLTRPLSPPAPPRPPRSSLRPVSAKSTHTYHSSDQFSSLSSPSGSSTGGDSPFKGPQAVLERRTLLNVRPRSAPNSTDTSPTVTSINHHV